MILIAVVAFDLISAFMGLVPSAAALKTYLWIWMVGAVWSFVGGPFKAVMAYYDSNDIIRIDGMHGVEWLVTASE